MIGERRAVAFLSGDSAWNVGYDERFMALGPKLMAFLSGDSAWNAVEDAAPTPAPAAVEQRQVQLAITPHGWVKAAMAANPTMESRTTDGKQVTVVSFTLKGKYKINGYVNNQNLLEKVETWFPNPVLGDMLVETSYSDYRNFSGVKFPARILHKQGGFPVLDLTVSEVQPNLAANIEVPEAVRQAGPPVVRMESQKVADGVWFLTGTSNSSVAVEFKDYVAVVEGPLNEERSLAVIAEVKKLVPHKPIRYLINTHHHFDHSGGIRTYVSEGATIVTHEMNKEFYEHTFQMPRTLIPDQLSQNPKAAIFQSVTDKYVLTDGTRTVELYPIQGNPHDAGMLMAYLPKEKLLIEADAFSPLPPKAPPYPSNIPAPAVNPFTVSFQENLQRLKLDVRQIVPLHGRVAPIAELRKALEKSR